MIRIIKKRNEIVESLLDNYKSKSLNESIVNQLKLCKSLKDALEFVDNSNMTPLLIAAKHGNTNIVQLLIKEKANPYVQD